MSITVLDAEEQPVSGAVVGLFDSREAWSNREYPVQVWKATDVSGEVIFASLKEQLYYIYVRKDLADNSGDMISTTNKLLANQRYKVVIHIY
ncbi:MAG: hypothetical protein J7L89_06030 [Bacteroidales bacterium]|nr:hypothetical protein [Bacteroidales bacterium]